MEDEGFLIDKDIGNIVELLKDNDILKIIAPTASGKSFGLPLRLAERGYDIIISSSFSSPYSSQEKEENKIRYISPKDLINNFDKEIRKRNAEQNILIIDEVDTGSLENYVLMSLWREKIGKRGNKGKLILTSNLPHNFFPDYPNYFVKPYFRYNADIKYLRDFSSFMESSDEIVKLINSFSSFSSFPNKNKLKGDVLVFVPDGESVNVITNKLKDYSAKDKVSILSIYENSPDIQKLQKEENEKGEQKGSRIIVSTDIAKTSLSLKNVSVVIDSMREIRGELSPMGGYRVSERYISKRDAELRAARGGVFSDCLVYRCISQNTYETLSEFTQEEILRTPLHYSIIDLLKLPSSNIKRNKNLLLNTLSDIPEFNETYKLMLNYSLIDVNNKVTVKGEKIRQLPFSLKNSIIYWYLKENKVKNAKLIVGLIDQYDDNVFIFSFPPSDNNNKNEEYPYSVKRDIHVKTYFNPYRGRDDLETAINIWNEFILRGDVPYINPDYLNFVSSLTLKKNKKRIIIFGENEREIMDSIIGKLYGKNKAVLDKKDEISAIYSLEKEKGEKENYRISVSSINTIDQTRPLHVYPFLTLSIDNLNLFLFSYVPLNIKYQKSEENHIVYP